MCSSVVGDSNHTSHLSPHHRRPVALNDDSVYWGGTHLSVGLPTQKQTTASYWLKGDANPLARAGANASFAHDVVDIVVIGSGITGVSFVHHFIQALKSLPIVERRDRTITMLEARDFCSGATGRNGGHFLALPYDGFSSRSSRTDEPPSQGDGMRAALLEMETVKNIRSLIERNGWAEDVNLRANDHTRIFLTPEEENEDLKEYTTAKDAGVPWDGIYRLTRDEMIKKHGVNYPGVTIPAGSIWPVKLATKIFQLAMSEADGASVALSLHTHTPAETVELLDAGVTTHCGFPLWTVRTPRGPLITRFVIYASNAWTAHLLPQFAMPISERETKNEDGEDSEASSVKLKSDPPRGTWIAPYRGQMVATRANVPPNKLSRRGWASDWMENYWLPSPLYGSADDHENALILLGGGRDDKDEDSELGVADDSALDPQIMKSLRAVLPRAFPQFFEPDTQPEMEWSGIMGFTDTEDPIVGPVPNPRSEGRQFLPGQYVSAGYNGHGMSRAYSCAGALAQMVLQEMHGGVPQTPDWLPRSFTTRV